MVEATAQTKPLETGRFHGTVRLLRENDLPSLKPILETWIHSRDTGELLPEEVEEDLQVMRDSCSGKNDRTYFVAEEGRIVGVIGMKPPKDALKQLVTTENPVELVNAYVAADKRKGQGVGTALVQKLESEARLRGNTEIILDSGPRYKDSGWGFYDKLSGFSRVGIAVKLYGEGGDAPVWHKVLT